MTQVGPLQRTLAALDALLDDAALFASGESDGSFALVGTQLELACRLGLTRGGWHSRLRALTRAGMVTRSYGIVTVDRLEMRRVLSGGEPRTSGTGRSTAVDGGRSAPEALPRAEAGGVPQRHLRVVDEAFVRDELAEDLALVRRTEALARRCLARANESQDARRAGAAQELLDELAVARERWSGTP